MARLIPDHAPESFLKQRLTKIGREGCAKAMVDTVVAYEGGLRCRAEHVGSGAVVVTDAPTDNHGLGNGFSPTDLLSVSLGSCILSVMGIAAQSMDVELSGATAVVSKKDGQLSPSYRPDFGNRAGARQLRQQATGRARSGCSRLPGSCCARHCGANHDRMARLIARSVRISVGTPSYPYGRSSPALGTCCATHRYHMLCRPDI